MSRLKKFWIAFLSFLPLTAAAWAPFVIAGAAGAVAIAGFSIYRSLSPVSMTDAYQFFSTCWSCEMFSGIMSTMSDILPKIYSALGKTVVPFAILLMAIWLAWTLIDNFLNNKNKDFETPWSLASDFTNRFVKLGIVSIFLLVKKG